MLIRDVDYRSNFRNKFLDFIESSNIEFMFHPKIDYLLFSKTGEVKSLKTNKVLKQSTNQDGYKMLNVVFSNGKRRCVMVHRLMAEAFYPYLGTNNYFYEVNHKDGNKTNNSIENLEWLTRQENLQHARDNNLFVSLRGEQNGNCKYSKKDIVKMKEMYDNGNTIISISKHFGIDRNYLARILKGEKRNE